MDHVTAYMWYKAVADRGEHRATAALKSLSSLMTDAQIKQATAATAKLKISAFHRLRRQPLGFGGKRLDSTALKLGLELGAAQRFKSCGASALSGAALLRAFVIGAF
jgi:hypothetical protein